jgi:AraC-like DNA-binding protein
MPSAYFLLILREYGKAAPDRAALLEGTVADGAQLADPAAEITLGQQLRQIRNANRVLEPGWSLAMGARFHAATHGPVGIGAVSAPTVRHSLDVMTRFSHLRSPHFQLRASRHGDHVRLVPEDRVALLEAERTALLDLVMLSTQGLVESILGRQMREARFEFSYPAPGHARRYEDYFHAPVRFGCREPAIVIPAAWLEVDCPLADPALFEAALRNLAIANRRTDDDVLVARVATLIGARGDRLRIGEASHVMRISRRTLARRLLGAGTSYRRLVEAGRKTQADALLRDRQLDVAEVGYRLGYQDPANFGRACRRWFGMSPGRYRRHVRDEG